MKSIRLICFLTLITGLSNSAHAYGYLTNLNGPGVTIETYFLHKNGGLSPILAENHLNSDECMSSNHVYLKANHPNYKNIVAAALAAFASGKEIGIHGDGCEVIPFWGGTTTRATISDLWVFQ